MPEGRLRETIFQSTSSIQRKTAGGSSCEAAGRFQSTSSIQRKTRPENSSIPAAGISIHFLYTEEDTGLLGIPVRRYISIHFLYTEEDSPWQLSVLRVRISIHFLYTEEDVDGGFYRRRAQIFQSTSSIQRKTTCNTKCNTQ